jgi:hypothetical protein
MLVAVASVGFGASLLLQERLIAHTDEAMLGQALGLNSAGMMTMQAVGATVAGLIAQHLPAGPAITVMAVLSLLVTALLSRGLRLSAPGPAVENGVPGAPARG